MRTNGLRVTLLAIALSRSLCSDAQVSQQSEGQASRLDKLGATLSIKNRTFADALRLFTEQTNLNIAADDIPLKNRANITVQGSARQVLDSISKTFDYAWRLTQQGDVVLNKRFDDPDEHPQFDKAEAIDTAAIIAHMLRRMPTIPEFNQMGPTLRTLYSSLTPGQLSLAADGHSLRVKDLTTQQQKLVSDAVVHDAYGNILIHWETLASQLSSLEESVLQLSPPTFRSSSKQPGVPIPSPRRFVFEWRRRGQEHAVTLPNLRGFENQTYDGPISPAPIDPPAKLSSSTEATLNKDIQLAMGETTIGEAASRIQTLTGIITTVTNPIREHRMILFASSSSTLRVLGLIREACGVSWQGSAQDQVLLYRRRPSAIRSYTEISGAIRAALPKGWLSFLAHLPTNETNLLLPEEPKTIEMKKLGLYEGRVGLPIREKQIAQILRQAADKLTGFLQSRGEMTRVRYLDMNEEQKQILTVCLILNALDLSCRNSGAGAIVHNNPWPYQVDPGSAVVSTQDGGISIYSLIDQLGIRGRMGFGAALQNSPR